MGVDHDAKAPAQAPAGDETQKKKHPDPNVGIIYLTVFFDFFASGIVLPLLQTHARSELGASGFNVGMVFTAYSAASIVGSFVFGRMSDVIGRRPVILISLLMSSVTLYLTAVVTTLDALVQTRALAGFFSETSVCQAYIADKSAPEERPKYLGHMGAFIGLAFMLGPAAGALIGGFGGFYAAAMFTTVVTFANFVYAYFKLPESLNTRELEEEEKELKEAQAGVSWGVLASTLMQPSVLLVLVAQFISTLGFMGWNTTFGVFSQERLGYTRRGIGWAFAWSALALILAMWKMRGFVKNAPARITTCLCYGNAALGLGLASHTYITSTWMIFIPLFAVGFGYGLVDLCYQTIISLTSGKHLQGSMLGALSSVTALARAVAPVVAGYLYDSKPEDIGYTYTVLGALPLGLILLAPVCAAKVLKKKEE